MKIIDELEQFYTAEAQKYAQTRRKHRPDGERLLEVLKNLEMRSPKLLELGCGSGRLISYLDQAWERKFAYTGVDLSSGLLKYAKEANPGRKFVCSEMTSFLEGCKQESFDAVVACASFQHIPSAKARLAVMKNAYRALRYEGLLVMTNRAFSEWFLRKHWKVVLQSGLKAVFTLGTADWRDVMIPWKAKKQVYHRYYHLFGLEELEKLAEMAGFWVEECHFLDKGGKKVEDWHKANNSFLVARKVICKG